MISRRYDAVQLKFERGKALEVGDVLRPPGCGQTGAPEIRVTGAVVVAIVAVPFLISSAGTAVDPVTYSGAFIVAVLQFPDFDAAFAHLGREVQQAAREVEEPIELRLRRPQQRRKAQECTGTPCRQRPSRPGDSRGASFAQTTMGFAQKGPSKCPAPSGDCSVRLTKRAR